VKLAIRGGTPMKGRGGDGAPRERAPAKVINLMDALRRSVEAERGSGERRKPERHAAAHQQTPKKAGRSSRQKKAG
jgi:hypothetical protein